MGPVSAVSGGFCYFCGHFLDIEGDGEEGKIHRDLVFAEVAEAVDRDEVGLLVARQPDVVDVAAERLLNAAARVDVVPVTVDNDLEHHPRVVRAAAALLVQLVESLQIQTVDDRSDQTHRVIRSDILIDSLRKKHQLVVYVLTKV